MIYHYKSQRHRYIMSEIQRHGRVSVSVLARTLNVVERTIRRDIAELESTGRVKPCYGGAILVNNPEGKLYYNSQVKLYQNMKIDSLSNFANLNSGRESSGGVFIIGSFNTDLVYRIIDFPESGETISAINSCCLPGGKGSNQAIACMMAGARTHFTVKLGDDEFSEKARFFLRGLMLDKLTCFEEKNCATGSAIVMVSEAAGDNAIVINPGANQTISADEIASCYDAISKSDVFLTQMENNVDATELALKFAHACGLITILNPAPWRKEVSNLLHMATIITPNLTEASSIVGFTLDSNDDIRQAAEEIHAQGASNVLITLGKEGCWLFDGKKHRRFSAFPAINIDTAGAGDAFNGALAARLSKGECIESAIIYASAFASLAVEREGASNMPKHEQVLEKINKIKNLD
ncbi:PfkB family carbohydrate kinase [Citrobacter telavivensis]